MIDGQHEPLNVSVRGPSTHRQGLHVEDEEVQGQREDDGSQQPEVDPGRHPDQRLVLRQAVEEMQSERFNPSAVDVSRRKTTMHYRKL